MTSAEIIEQVFKKVGRSASAEGYVRCALEEAIRLTREDAFSEIYSEEQENVGTKPEDRLWIEAARQVVNRMAAFDERKSQDFAQLLSDLIAEVRFRNESEVREIKKTMVEFLAPQAVGGMREGMP